MAGIYAALSSNLRNNPGLEVLPDIRCGDGHAITGWNRIINHLENGIHPHDIFNMYQIPDCCRETLLTPQIIYNNVDYDPDIIEGIEKPICIPNQPGDILRFLRLGWNLLTTTQSSLTQEDQEIFSEYVIKRPMTASEVKEFTNRYSSRLSRSYHLTRDLKEDDITKLEQISSIDAEQFKEIIAYYIRLDKKAAIQRNMRVIRGVPPPIQTTTLTARDRVMKTAHLTYIDSSGQEVSPSQPSSSSSSSSSRPSSKLETFTPSGEEIKLPSELPDDYNQIKNPVRADVPLTHTFLPDVVRRDYKKEPEPIQPPRSPLFPDEDIRTYRTDKITGITLLPGQYIIKYLQVGGGAAGGRKYIIPMIGQPLEGFKVPTLQHD